MTEPVVKPTVGRRLWYWPGFEDRNALAPMHPVDHPNGVPQPFDAGVLFVWSDTAVNLQITDHHGGIWFREKVRILTPGEDHNESDALGVAQWMPYQAKQAEKDKAEVDKPVPRRNAQGIDSIITVALAGNDLCRSAYQVANRMLTEHGPSFGGTNWKAMEGMFKTGLQAQHKVLKPYLEDEVDRGNTETFTARLDRLVGTGDGDTPYPLVGDTSTHETALSETAWRQANAPEKQIAIDAGAEAEQADSWREVYGFLVAHAQPFMMQPPVPKRGVDQALSTLRELVKYARIGTNLTTKVVPAEKTGSMHEAVRSVLHHHKLATKADGVIESDLIAAVLDCVKPVVVPNEVSATMANRMHGEAYGVDWVYAGKVCQGSACGSTTGRDHSKECEKDHTMSATWGTTDIDKINLCYDGAYVHETEGQASVRRQVAEKLWGRGWQEGWSAGWQAHAMAVGDESVEPATPQSPEYKA